VAAADDVTLRALTPTDFEYVVTHLDSWWGGRAMTPLLPRLFFDHFHDTSVAAVDAEGTLVGFLVGFLSPAQRDTAYVHFVGVDPRLRGSRIGARLHEAFADIARSAGRTRIEAVTSPANEASIAFHTWIGFSARLDPDHDGPDIDRIVFQRVVGQAPAD
jgi:RimJ/RimL family protein N-acetyltransferase